MNEQQLEAWNWLLERVEDALARGLNQEQVRGAVEAGISSIEADRSFALDEEGRDPYPHLSSDANKPSP